MRIIKITYQKPANLFIEAIQKYCKSILEAPNQNGITQLSDVKDKIQYYAESQLRFFPKCTLDNLDVISHLNAVHQFYNLIYCDTKPMITITARPDEFEAAFREYDTAKPIE